MIKINMEISTGIEQKPLKMPETHEELKVLLQKARLEGFKQGGNTAAHLFNSKITPVLAVADWAQSAPDAPKYLAEFLESAPTSIMEISKIFTRMQQVERLTPLKGYSSIIDLDQSTGLNQVNKVVPEP